MSEADPYLYPGTGVLRNKLDIRVEKNLERVERRLTTERARQDVATGALADHAGHPIDLTRLDREAWMAASRAAHDGDYTRLAAEIARTARR